MGAATMQFERFFRLTGGRGRGVSCGEDGLFAGDTALLEKVADREGQREWRPRLQSDLARDLTKAYGLPVDLSGKLAGLEAVAGALNRGDIAHAQVAALLLRLSDPPNESKGSVSSPDVAPQSELSEGDCACNPARLGKFNPYHDERGRFTTAEGAVAPDAAKPKRPTEVQVASEVGPMTKPNAGSSNIAYPEGWQPCHEKCLAQTEGVWPPSDRPGLYRRCMRECLGAAGDDY